MAAAPRLLSQLTSPLQHAQESILSLAVSPKSTVPAAPQYLYAGTQGGDIDVWDLVTLAKQEASLLGHNGAILSLVVVPAAATPKRQVSLSGNCNNGKNGVQTGHVPHWLISASGDGTIRVWNLATSSSVYLIHCPRDNMGDILSLVWIPSEFVEDDERTSRAIGMPHGRLFAGLQDTSIMWIDLPPPPFSPFSAPVSPLANLHPATSLHPAKTSPSALTTSLLQQDSSRKSATASAYKSGLPIITKPHNKFFDTLGMGERPPPLVSSAASRSIGTGSNAGTPPGGNSPGFAANYFRSRNGNASATGSPPISRSLTDKPLPGGEEDNYFGKVELHQRMEDLLIGEDGVYTHAESEAVSELQIQASDVKMHAHFGYVYCLAVGRSKDQPVLISGSGDELIKLWNLPTPSSAPIWTATLEGESDAVLALVVKDNVTLVGGYQGGRIKVWDLDTLSCIKMLHPGEFDVLTLTLINDEFYSGCGDGSVQRWDKSFNCIANWKAHEKIALALASTIPGSEATGERHLITGGSDAVIKVWDVLKDESIPTLDPSQGFHGRMFHTLAKLVAFRTIADEEHREECRQGALYLKGVFKDLGASTVLLPGAPGLNPIVVATFLANRPQTTPKRRKRVLCYGHYDVISADDRDKWVNGMDPFEMVGLNGWIYGRGVSDNKGPILAIGAAVSELQAKGILDVDLIMVIEGEEETGSAGFQAAMRAHADTIGEVDVILVSNSYWIGEDIPCLTFGLRGVIHTTLNISSDRPDMHSGISGGTTQDEPLINMVHLLATLTDTNGRIAIPGFENGVSLLEDKESKLLDEVVIRCKGNIGSKFSRTDDPRHALMSRWREPALSMHNISIVTGSASKTLISSSVTSTISVRIVPDQSLDTIRKLIKSFLETKFQEFGSTNVLKVEIRHVADWWLGDLESKYLKCLAGCIEKEWNIKPLYIREGGSIPSLPFLEQQFNARAVHFPMGTSTDSAHLPDERIRVINLERGRSIIYNWLGLIADLD